MKRTADPIFEYLENLPEERKPYFNKLRKTILENLPDGFEEQFIYGMIGYVVPHSLYPDGYHVNSDLPLPFLNIGSQKNFIGLYHMGIYADAKLQEWFVKNYKDICKYKIDMGKSCVRLKRMEDIPFELIGELVRKVSVKDWIATYTKVIQR